MGFVEISAMHVNNEWCLLFCDVVACNRSPVPPSFPPHHFFLPPFLPTISSSLPTISLSDLLSRSTSYIEGPLDRPTLHLQVGESVSNFHLSALFLFFVEEIWTLEMLEMMMMMECS